VEQERQGHLASVTGEIRVSPVQKPGTGIITRNLRPGETLLKPGDKIKSVYVIQSGRISLCQAKGGKVVEIAQMSAGQSIGDEAVFGPMQWNLTALALRETVIVEMPLEAISSTLNGAPPSFKILIKALADRIKVSFNEVKTLKLNREAIPCPADNTAKVFGVLYHVGRMIGETDAEGKAIRADWGQFKKFAFEVFEESVVRLEDALNILIKLGYARVEGPTVHLMDMKQVEAFFDYYGNYHFKGGYDDLLKTNAKMQKVTEEFLRFADGYPVDRGGNAHLPYKATIDAMKKELGASFEADQLFRLEQKGLFIKRTATQDGGTLSFYRPDFEQMMLNWKILRELELWNEKGFVDVGDRMAAPSPTEPDPSSRAIVDPVAERKKWAEALAGWKPVAFSTEGAPKLRSGEKAEGEVWCHICMSVVDQKQKSCHVCGADLAQGKAA
jgi:CRP-like cAMP-binding protein